MPDLYPTPGNVTGLSGLINHSNTVVNGMFTPLVLLAIFIGILILLVNQRYRLSDSIALSGIISTILGALLWAAHLLQDRYVVIALAAALLGLIASIFDKG